MMESTTASRERGREEIKISHGVSLASAMASSSESKEISGSSGPKVSSRKGSMSVSAPVTTVGSKKLPRCSPSTG